jgi:general secretion pathway protein I
MIRTRTLIRTRTQKRTRLRGFTLIELMLAMAIFAFAASSILGLISTTAQNVGLLQQMTFASWVAENRIAELEVEKQWPPKNNHTGEATMAGITWHWKQTVAETAAPQMRAVTISVYENKGDKNSIYDIETYVVKRDNTSSGLGG